MVPPFGTNGAKPEYSMTRQNCDAPQFWGLVNLRK
jgi:hypothetical protein